MTWLRFACALALDAAPMFAGPPPATPELPRLQISPNHRFLVTEKGKHFSWMGDTAWWLTLIAPADVDLYLDHRAQHRFNVIQFHCGGPARDYAGRLPYRDDNPLSPNEEYWRNVDSIVERATRPGGHAE